MITLGFATINDYDGAWATLEAALTYHRHIIREVVIVDSSPDPCHRKALEEHLLRVTDVDISYEHVDGPVSTSKYKNRVFELAKSNVVVLCDSHVMFMPNALESVDMHLSDLEHENDLVVGPCFSSASTLKGTNQMLYVSEPYEVPSGAEVIEGVVCRGGFLGAWVVDDRGTKGYGPVFEIAQQGTGALACRRDRWPKYLEHEGHGGDETYLFENARLLGIRTVCLPAFQWNHRWGAARKRYATPWRGRAEAYLKSTAELRRPDLWTAAYEHLRKSSRSAVHSAAIKYPCPR